MLNKVKDIVVIDMVNNREQLNEGWADLMGEKKGEKMEDKAKGDIKEEDNQPGMAKRMACGVAATTVVPVAATAAVCEGVLHGAGVVLVATGGACISASMVCEKAKEKTSSFMGRMWSEFKQGYDEAKAK